MEVYRPDPKMAEALEGTGIKEVMDLAEDRQPLRDNLFTALSVLGVFVFIASAPHTYRFFRGFIQFGYEWIDKLFAVGILLAVEIKLLLLTRGLDKAPLASFQRRILLWMGIALILVIESSAFVSISSALMDPNSYQSVTKAKLGQTTEGAVYMVAMYIAPMILVFGVFGGHLALCFLSPVARLMAAAMDLTVESKVGWLEMLAKQLKSGKVVNQLRTRATEFMESWAQVR